MESSATGKLAYLLLGQEDYKEHNSEVTQCRFSGSRCIIGKKNLVNTFNFRETWLFSSFYTGSCDIDGVVKVWSAAPGKAASFFFKTGNLIDLFHLKICFNR